MPVLVDTNVLLDLVTDDPDWADWSESKLNELSAQGLCVNPVIFTELCVGAERAGEVVELLDELRIELHELSLDALFLAAKAFQRYRQLSGSKRSSLPDFYIGAQALDQTMRVLTRDTQRFRTYFPEVDLICP
ncbi:MAG: PIN domain-containing protein [Verrucomicrobia bacterium]|jgi:predicted nucleic acid-binding protein|nr:PIN domain-containing protein [Verrucomicrobiota bacterium]